MLDGTTQPAYTDWPCSRRLRCFLVVQVFLLNSFPTVDNILLYNALAFGLQQWLVCYWIVVSDSFFDLGLVQF